MSNLLIMAALTGCLPAARLSHGHWTGEFVITAPAGWVEVQNRRAPGHHHLVLRAPDKCCTITVERRRETAETRALPLSLVAEILPLETGRIHGVVGEPIALHQLDLQGREAWAATLLRHNGPQSWLVTMVSLRADGQLWLVSLESPRGVPPHASRAWERVLGSFALPNAAPDLSPPWEPEPFLDEPPSEAAPS